jgi:hypothetical protein
LTRSANHFAAIFTASTSLAALDARNLYWASSDLLGGRYPRRPTARPNYTVFMGPFKGTFVQLPARDSRNASERIRRTRVRLR